jgi:tetratricopeptide (TPR) repeat protein
VEAGRVVAMFRQAVAFSIRPGQAEAALGAHLCAAGGVEDGVALMEASLATFRDTVVYENLGKAYADKADWARARDAYAVAVASGIRYAADASSLAKAEWALGEKGRAFARLELLRELSPGNPKVALTQGGILYQEGRFEECLEALKPADRKGDPAIGNMRAAALIRLGRVPEALGVLESLTVKHPDYAPAWVNLGALRYANGDVPAARSAFEKAIALDPGNQSAKGYLAQLPIAEPPVE